MLWQEVLRNLYWDLQILDGAVLEVGSFSSGQVADPLGKDSNMNSWPREKQVGDEKGNFGICPPFSKLPCFKPDQGIATDALAEKRSKDLINFGCDGKESS